MKSEKYAKIIAVILPLLIVSIPLSLLVGYPEGESVASHLLLGNNSHYIVVAVLSNFILFLTLIQVFFTWKALKQQFWINGIRAFISRIHIGITAIAELLATTAYWFYNFIGFYLP